MLDILVDNILVVFGGKVFQQIVGIPMGTNCAPLLAEIYISVLTWSGIHTVFALNRKKIASQFNFIYRYIDDILSINNPDFESYLGQMYTAELEIKDKTESNTSASYLDLLPSIESDGQLRTSLYDKRDDFNFHITNFPFLFCVILTLLPNFGGFHRTLQRMPLADRGRLLLWTPGTVPFGTCICSNVETILSWTCHVNRPFEFRTSLGTSILFL